MKISLSYSAFSYFLAVSIRAQDPTTYFEGQEGRNVYTDWYDKTSYTRNSFLSSKDGLSGVAIHWTANSTHINLAIAGKAGGWIGFGLAESGSMLGADIILFTAVTGELVDSYVLDQSATPLPDDCQSWTLINSVVQDGFIIFEAQRLLDTQDTQDRAIIDDSNFMVPATRVISAWGDSNEASFHGYNNVARKSIRFFGSMNSTAEIKAFQAAMDAESEGNFVIKADDYSVPAEETFYHEVCLSEDEIRTLGVPIDNDLHVIGIEPLIDPRAAKHVHHFIVSGTIHSFDKTTTSCDDFPGFEVAYVYAPGDLPLSLPSNVGGPLGATGFRSFHLEIHYDNPDYEQGIVDSSGVRFYYTSQKRQYDLGVFQTGDPNVELYGKKVSINGGYAQHIFECESSCSSNFVVEPVTVIREHLHMHASGVSMTNMQIRNGQVIREGKVQFWDFHQQGNLAVAQQPFDIQPGDAFRTICNYNSKNEEIWGLGSSDEMCIAFLYYYPRQVVDDGSFPFMCGIGFDDFLPGCGATYTVTTDFNKGKLARIFGTAPNSCPSQSDVVEQNKDEKTDRTSSSPPSTSKLYAFIFVAVLLIW